ncbi:MAG: DUF2807 domain-containing protein [Saprospiraceae bacterium]|nr:DUF2807 domain-containing protein [Saprospiraceae bacterium]
MIKYWIILILTFGGFRQILAQNRIIHGNGRVEQAFYPLESFRALVLDLNAEVGIHNGGMPQMSVSADANLLAALNVQVKNQVLTLDIKKGFWIESGSFKIDLTVPYLVSLETDGSQTGMGAIKVEDINTDQFSCQLTAGTITLTGRTNQLIVHSSNQGAPYQQGVLDASGLIANQVEATIGGSNRAKVQAIHVLEVDLRQHASLSYTGNPDKIITRGITQLVAPDVYGVPAETSTKTTGNPRKQLDYIQVTVRNNSWKRQAFVIKGPTENGHGFSYGFALMPFATRQKTVPPGTRIFLEGKLFHQPLITFETIDAGTVKNIFQKQN